jgi:hypothetical protein
VVDAYEPLNDKAGKPVAFDNTPKVIGVADVDVFT